MTEDKHISPFDWDVRNVGGKVCVCSTPVWESGPVEFHNFGEVGEVLEDVETPEEFGWRHFHNGIVWDADSRGTVAHDMAVAQKRAKDAARNVAVCNRWLEAFKLPIRQDNTWRACSLNRVLHPQFGPALTAATNGVDVIIVSSPSTSADWMIVHRENIIGPVTSSEVSVSEWDWLHNRKLMQLDESDGPTAAEQSEARQKRYDDAREAVGLEKRPLPSNRPKREATKVAISPMTALKALEALLKAQQ